MNASNILFLGQPHQEQGEGEKDSRQGALRMSPALRERVTGLAVVVAIHIILVAAVVLALHRVMRPVPPDVAVRLIEPPKPLPVTELPIPLPLAKISVPVPHIDLPVAPVVETPAVTAAPAPAPVSTPVPAPQPEIKSAPAAEAAGDSEPMVDASAAGNAYPAYPAASRNQGEHGTVILDVLVLVDGTVGDIRIDHSSGFDRLDNAAKRAVRQWHFIPAHQGGKQIAKRYKQPIVFNLDKA